MSTRMQCLHTSKESNNACLERLEISKGIFIVRYTAFKYLWKEFAFYDEKYVRMILYEILYKWIGQEIFNILLKVSRISRQIKEVAVEKL